MSIVASTTPTPILMLRQATGGFQYTDLELKRLLDHVGDVDLASVALRMRPRPAWLQEVVTNRGSK